MQSKVDRQIKRWLNSISYEVHKAIANNSIHYDITLRGESKSVRFSDHFSVKAKDYIDIIKISDTVYTIRYNNIMSTTLYADDILAYLKGLILVAPDFDKCISDTKDAISSLNKQLIKLSKQELVKEKEKLAQQTEKLNEKVNNQAATINQLQKSIAVLNLKVDKFSKLKNALKEITKFSYLLND